MNAYRSDDLGREFLHGALGITLAEPFCAYIITDDDGSLVGAFAFTAYTGTNVELTICSRKPLSVRVTRYIARLAFEELRACRIQAHTRVENSGVVTTMRKLGFRYEGASADYYGEGRDAFRYALLRRDQKLIRIGDGQPAVS